MTATNSEEPEIRTAYSSAGVKHGPGAPFNRHHASAESLDASLARECYEVAVPGVRTIDERAGPNGVDPSLDLRVERVGEPRCEARVLSDLNAPIVPSLQARWLSDTG